MPEGPPVADPPAARFVDLRTGLLLLLTGCVMAGNGLVVPMLSIYGATFAASATLVGMLITIFGIGRLAISFPTGLVARHVGTRTLLIAGNGLLMAGALGAALSTSLGFLLVCRAIQGVGSGIYLTAAGIVIAETSRKATRGRFMAMYQGAVHTGAGVGPTIGGFLAEGLGITAPFWAYALLSLFAMGVALCFPARSVDAAAANGAAPVRPDLSSLLRNLPLLAVYFISFTSGFTRTAAHWQMVPILASERMHMGFDGIGIALTVTAFANVAMLPAAGWLVDRLGARLMTPLATIAMALSLTVLAIDTGPVGFWTGMALLGVTGGLIGPALGVSLIEAVNMTLIGPALGAQRSFGDVGFILGPILIGALVDGTGIGAAGGLAAIAVTVALSAVSFWLVGRRPVGLEPGS